MKASLRIVIFIFLFSICKTASSQIHVTYFPTLPTIAQPCTPMELRMAVWNADTGAQSFGILINLGQYQQVYSVPALPTGFADSIYTDAYGNYILYIYRTTPLAASARDTVTYDIEGTGCETNAEAANLYQTVSITNDSGSTYTGSGGYMVNSSYNYPFTFGYLNSVPDLTQVAGIAYIDSVVPGNSASFDVVYINSGPVVYNGAISIDGGFACADSLLTINNLTIYVGDTTGTPFITIPGPVNFPVQICGLSINPNQYLFVQLNYTLSNNSCLTSTGCTGSMNLLWGCNTPCLGGVGTPTYCHNNDSIPIPLTVIPVPPPFDVAFYRILPVGNSYDGFPWENVCMGMDSVYSEEEWKFVIINKGSQPADSTMINLQPDGSLPTGTKLNTMIRMHSIHINEPDSSLSIYTSLPGVSTAISTYQAADFDSVNPLACYMKIRDTLYPMDTPVKGVTAMIPIMQPGERVVISFRTYRCCAWDNTPGRSLYYNRWSLNVIPRTPCDIGVRPDVISPGGGAELVDTPHNTYGYPAWTTYDDAYRDISLQAGYRDDDYGDLFLGQNFNPLNINLYAPTGGCGDTVPFTIRNTFFNTSNNASDDFDAMLLCENYDSGGTGILSVPGLVGVNPQGSFTVTFYWDTSNVHISNVNMIGVLGGSTITWQPYTLTTNSYGATATFRLSDVGFPSTVDLREFMVGSFISFGLNMCCFTYKSNPNLVITTYYNVDEGSAHCNDCNIPLAICRTGLVLHCPGCVTPGLIADVASITRLHLGLQDTNNNRLADDNTPITPASPYYNLVAINSSTIGDTLVAVSSGYLQDGEEVLHGFTLNDMQTVIGNDTLFNNFYLEQYMYGADTVGLSCLKATLTFYHGDTLKDSTNIAVTALSSTLFIFHTTDSAFSCRPYEKDRFTVTAYYLACTDPSHTIHLTANNIMYLTKGAESLATDPLANASDPLSYIIAHDSTASGDSAAYYALQASPPTLFWCEGSGADHQIFPLFTSYSEGWEDANSCTKQVSINVTNQIGNPLVDGTNLFPFEYRTIPAIYMDSIIRGPLLSNDNPIYFTLNSYLPGYTFTPVSITTVAPYLYDPLHNINVLTSLNYTPSNQVIIAASPVDWMANTGRLGFIDPQDTMSAIDTLIPNGLSHYVTLNSSGRSELLVGDEIFTETMIFDVNTVCASVDQAEAISPEEASCLVPGGFASCSGADYRVGDTSTYGDYTSIQSGDSLHAPDPSLTNMANSPSSGYPHIALNTVDNLITLTSSGFSGNVPNVYFYIETSSGGVSTLPAGIGVGPFVIQSASGTYDTIAPASFSSGGNSYYGYAVPNGSDSFSVAGTGTRDFHVVLVDSVCFTTPPIIYLPVHYVWSCDSFPSGLPTNNGCDRDTYALITYEFPVVDLYSEVTAPSSFSTCNPVIVDATLISQELGGAGNFVAYVTLPDYLTVMPVNSTLQLTPPLGSPVVVTLPGSLITHTTDANPAYQDWTINIDSLTAFSTTSLLGVQGLINASGDLSLGLALIAGCNAPDTPLHVTVTMKGWKYCDLINFNPLAPGDISDTFPTVVITPQVSGFQACGPFINPSVTEVYCYGLHTGSISLSPTVSPYYGVTPVYSYAWAPSEANSPTLTGLGAGTYAVTVTDTVMHCSATASEIITQPSAALSASITHTNTISLDCSTGSASVSVSGGTPPYTYIWNNGETGSVDTALGGGGEYYVSVTDANGCTLIDSVYLPAEPAFNISGVTSICDGSTTVLTTSSGYTGYSWSGTPPSGISPTTAQITNVSAAGTYTVTATYLQCTVTASISIAEDGLPDPVATITGFEMCSVDTVIQNRFEESAPFMLDQSSPCTQVCSGSLSRITVSMSNIGDSSSLTVVGGTATYLDSLSSSATGVFDITWGSPGQGSIVVRETAPGGCSVSKTFCIDILATPKANFGIVGVTDYTCTGHVNQFIDSSTNTLAGNNAIYSNITGWQWDFGDGTSSSLENPTHTYAAQGTYWITLTVYSPCYCSSEKRIKMVVDTGGAIAIECPSIECKGDTATYTELGCSKVNWSCTGGKIVSYTTTTVTIAWDSTLTSGFGYVSAVPAGCQTCLTPTTVAIPVLSSVPISGPQTICINNATYYSVPLWPGTQYAWTITNGTPNPHATILGYSDDYRALIRCPDTGSFTINLTYSSALGGCTYSTSLKVNVVNGIVAHANPDSGCVGIAATFSLSDSALSPIIIIAPDGSKDTLASGASVNSASFTPTLAGAYIVNFVSPNVCIDTPLTWHVNLTPAISMDTLISGDTAVCRNTPYTYLARVPAPAGTQYVWSLPNPTDGTIIGANTGNVVVVKWTNSGFGAVCTLDVKISPVNGGSCIGTSAKHLYVTIIEPNADFYAPHTVCPDAYYSNIYAVSDSQDYYTWSFVPANLASCHTGDDHNPMPQIFFNYISVPTYVVVTLTVTRCNITVSHDDSILIIPAPSVSITSAHTACQNNDITFTAVPGIDSTGTTYTWTTSDGRSFGPYTAPDSALTISFSTTGTQWVNVTAHYSTVYCTTTVTSANDTVIILPLPVISITASDLNDASICPDTVPIRDTLRLTGGTYDSSAVWSLNGTVISGAHGASSYVATAAGTYTVTVTGSNGCTASATHIISYCPAPPDSCPGITFTYAGMSIYCDSIYAAVTYSTGVYTFLYGNWVLNYVTPSSESQNNSSSSASVGIRTTGAGGFTLTYYCYIYDPGAHDTVYCTHIFYGTMPAYVNYHAAIACDSADNGYVLHLSDASQYANTPTAYDWTVSPDIAGVGSYSGTAVTTGVLTSGTAYHFIYTLEPSGCQDTFDITAPSAFPNAHFYYVDSPLVAGTNLSPICEGYSIRLQPTDVYNAGWTYHWTDAHDLATIYYYDPPKEYSFGTLTNNPAAVTLTVTDQYGCSATYSDSGYRINQNQLAGQVGPIFGANALVETENATYWCSSADSFTFDYYQVAGTTPTHWNWYNDAIPGTLATTSSYTNYGGPAGRYVCLVSDDAGCQFFSSIAGTISILPQAQVSLSGKRSYCVGDTVQLSADGEAHMSYQLIIGGTTYTGGPNWSIPNLLAGTYTALLVYKDTFATGTGTSTLCSDTAFGFSFEVYSTPNIAVGIEGDSVTCSPYSVGLLATTTSGDTTFAWSNGGIGAYTSVTQGGVYRAWLYGPGGCTAYADVQVPEDPTVMLQYAPYGCYSIACTTLTGAGIPLYGPPGVVAAYYAWQEDGDSVSGGIDSFVRAYIVHEAGDYSLTINDGVYPTGGECAATSSPTVQITASPACATCHLYHAVTASSCIAHNEFPVSLTIVNSTGAGTISLSSASGIISGLSSVSAPTGTTTYTFDYTANTGVTGVVKVTITLYYSGRECQDTFDMTLPTCHRSLVDSAMEAEGMQMMLMPNPATDNVTIFYKVSSIADPVGEKLNLVVMDIEGKLVAEQMLQTNAGYVSLDVSGLASGMYLVALRKDQTPLMTDKLVVTSR